MTNVINDFVFLYVLVFFIILLVDFCTFVELGMKQVTVFGGW